ncbi:MAG: VOC family protein [Planctomycetes bacterium]|nr:VOC family protein [Planctomycetota bacterium]
MTPPSPAVSLSRIGQIAINVHDVDRAAQFYEQTLGMKLLFRFPNLAFFDCSGVRLMLTRPSKPEFDHVASILYYHVADLSSVVANLEAQGVAMESPPSLVAKMPDNELWMAFFRDTEGNLLGLMSEVREA